MGTAKPKREFHKWAGKQRMLQAISLAPWVEGEWRSVD